MEDTTDYSGCLFNLLLLLLWVHNTVFAHKSRQFRELRDYDPTDVGFSRPKPRAILVSNRILMTNISAECGYQIPVTRIYSGGRISYIFTNSIPNIRALKS